MVPLTVACVEWGDYCGQGARYVRNLRAAVARHLAAPHRFVCLTDRPAAHPDVQTSALAPGLAGWWNKLELFRPGRFEGRVLYLDLDSFVIGPLDALAARKGIIHLGMWGWKQNDYGSGCMVWDAGEHAEAWLRLNEPPAPAPQRFRGDQDWLTALGGWEALPFPLVCSFKYHCKDGPPAGAAVVCCHGPRKPHLDLGERDEAWARPAWPLH